MNKKTVQTRREKTARRTSFLLTIVFVLSALSAFVPPVSASAPPEPEHVEGAYLYNFENDMVLYEKSLDKRIYPTSTVKIMTGIVAIEALENDMSRPITITAAMLANAKGNKIGLLEGETITAEQALYCMLINGANDAAMALAYSVAGSEEEFVKMMNNKANSLGARLTNYVNCTGMHDDNMLTSVGDVAKIAKYAYSLDLFMEITGSQSYVLEKTNMHDYRNVYNRNCLISKFYMPDYYYDKAIGMNAGSTVQGGFSIVAAARNSDATLTYLCVIMGAEDNKYSYSGAINFFDWAFEAYAYREVLTEKKIICEIPVNLSSTADYATLVPAEPLTVFLPADVDLENDVKISYRTDAESLDAPIKIDQKVGTATVTYNNEILGTVDIVATSDISRSEFLFALERIKEFSSGRFFRAALVACVVLSVLYVFFKARYREKRLRSRIPRTRRGKK